MANKNPDSHRSKARLGIRFYIRRAIDRIYGVFFASVPPHFYFKEPRSYIPALKWLMISFCFAFVITLPFYAEWAYFVIFTRDIPLLLGSLLGLFSIASVLFTPTIRRFSVGFFVGVLWFYFVGLGMRYFDMGFLIPLVVLGVGLFMGLVFLIGLFCDCLILRFAFLLLLSYLMPFGFDWIVIESVFAYSYFGVDKLHFALLILGLWLFFKYNKFIKLLGALALIGAIDFASFKPIETNYISNATSTHFEMKNLKIKIIQTNISQDFHYRIAQIHHIYNQHLKAINTAILEGYDAVILPESAFYTPLNEPFSENLVNELMRLSEHISIIFGALRVEDSSVDSSENKYFNSTYVFDKGAVAYFDKVRLVPFGEALPQWLMPLGKRFFPGIGGFSAGENYGYFAINGIKFKNAICYEGSSRDFYKDKPEFVIAMSNNAWFVPSIEPILQKILMKYYARLSSSTILHATNLSPSFVITP